LELRPHREPIVLPVELNNGLSIYRAIKIDKQKVDEQLRRAAAHSKEARHLIAQSAELRIMIETHDQATCPHCLKE